MSTPYRMPDPLKITGSNVTDNWSRFKEQWNNYVIAADLGDATEEKRAAVFLTCIGSDAYDVFRTFEFADAASRRKIDTVVAAFETYCVGAVNVTYERYIFNKRCQENGERFDVFLGDIRRLSKSCDFGTVADSILRDRIVVGIRDDATRHKLLQVRDLSLQKAIDICKASEAAGRQLKVMTSGPLEEVNAVARVPSLPSRSAQQRYGNNRSKSVSKRDFNETRKCKYCDRQHGAGKESCPAYGKTCRNCHKLNHFDVACHAKKTIKQKRDVRT